MDVCNDITGAWAYCHKCKFAGDVIDLALAYWVDTDIYTVIQKFLAAGISIPQSSSNKVLANQISNHFKYHVERRKRINDFWTKSRISLSLDNNKHLRMLQHKLGIRIAVNSERWNSGPGLFFGGANKVEIEGCFRKDYAQSLGKSQRESTGCLRVLRGPKWWDAIVIPFYDLPGRIKGLMFYGRNGDFIKDVAFKNVQYTQTGGNLENKDNACGITMYDAIYTADDKIFVMNDPFTALKLQMWHLQNSSQLAPLVSMFDNNVFITETTIWNTIKQKPIFWGKPDALLFRHAKAVNGRVCITGFTHEGPMKATLRTPLHEWLTRVDEIAEPWESVLEEVLAILPVPQAEAILVKMSLQPEEMAPFLKHCPDELRSRLEICYLRPKIRIASLKLGSAQQRISEEKNCWISNTDGQICNAVLQIDRIIHHEKLDKTYYSGVIKYKDSSTPFYALAETIDAAPFKWIRKLFIQQAIGYFEFIPSWEKFAIQIATRFKEPSVSKGYSIVGWNKDEFCFVFPKYLLSSDGQVHEDKTINMQSTKAPARRLNKPADFLEEEIKALENNADIFWAMTACIASNILSPVFGIEPRSIALTGEASNTGRMIAKELGCTEYNVRSIDTVEDITHACDEHNWPLIIRLFKNNTSGYLDWLLTDKFNNCIIAVDWYGAQAITVNTGWHLINTDTKYTFTAPTQVINKILPSFLQYVTKNKFQLPLHKKQNVGITFRTIRALSEWFGSLGGNPNVVLGAHSVLTIGDDTTKDDVIVDRFINMVCILYDDGILQLERDGFIYDQKNVQRALICIPGKDGSLGRIFIPKTVINKILALNNAPPLNNVALAQVFARTGRGEEDEYRGLTGWVIPEGLWDEYYMALKAKRKNQLRITE